MAPCPATARSIRQVGAAPSSAQRGANHRPEMWNGRPGAPSAAIEWKRCMATGKRQLKPVMATRPARAAASTIARASVPSMARGFSHRT
jgi:hypothetical protein